MKTKEQIYEQIMKWEEEHGESLLDYMGYTKEDSYTLLGFLIAKGFTEKAQDALEQAEEDRKNGYSFGDDDMLNLAEVYDGEDSWEKNNTLLAEFFSLTPYYQNKLDEFLKKN